MYRTMTVILLVVLCFCNCTRGQNTPDLSGTWKLNLEKSDYGDLSGPSSRTETIEQHDRTISELVVSEFRNKPQQYKLVYSADGKKTVLPADAGIKIGFVALKSISATWKGSALVVTQVLNYQDSDLMAKDTYTLSSDGNTLTVAVSLFGGDTAATYVFDRVR
jgi:hypothetical protein